MTKRLATRLLYGYLDTIAYLVHPRYLIDDLRSH
jgi:hypothetical protein